LRHSDGDEDWGFVLLGDVRVHCGLGGGYCVSLEFTGLMKAVCLISEQHTALRPPAICLSQIGRMLFKVVKRRVSMSVFPVAQSVQRLATGCTIRGLNHCGGEIFRTRPDRP